MAAIATNQNLGAAVSPIKIEKRKESRVELRVGLLELVASAMRARNLPARHLVRPIVFHATPKPLKEPHRTPLSRRITGSRCPGIDHS